MARRNLKTYIIIPAYNEGKVISSVIHDIRKCGLKKIIVVDDGSTDDTAIIAKRKKTIVLSHAVNRGKGAAVITGIEAAKILKAQAVVLFDGDGQHVAKDILPMILKLNQGYDVVLGSRFLRTSEGMPLFNRLANLVANWITGMMTSIWISDSQCGLRGLNTKAISLLKIESDRYEFESELIHEIKRYDLRYVELPVNIQYTQYSKGKQQRQNLSNGLRTLFKLLYAS